MSIKQAIEALELAIETSYSDYTNVKFKAAIAALRSMPAEPYAYAVYFPTEQRGELVHDLDELLEDMTNLEHEVTPLFATPHTEAVPPTPEQALRDALEAMGSARAQSLSAGDLLAVVCDVDSPLQAEPVAWVRFCGDGLYEGPVMNCDKTRMENVRQKLSEWTPLCAANVPETNFGNTPHTEAVRMSEARPSAEWYARMIQETEGLDEALPMGALMRKTPTPAERLAWLHGPDSHNVNGYEWGIFRVKWDGGAAVDVQHTYSDFSDLDAAIEQATAARLGVIFKEPTPT